MTLVNDMVYRMISHDLKSNFVFLTWRKQIKTEESPVSLNFSRALPKGNSLS